MTPLGVSTFRGKVTTRGRTRLASGKLDLGKVLQGDRFFALLMVRALTYGSEYALP